MYTVLTIPRGSSSGPMLRNPHMCTCQGTPMCNLGHPLCHAQDYGTNPGTVAHVWHWSTHVLSMCVPHMYVCTPAQRKRLCRGSGNLTKGPATRLLRDGPAFAASRPGGRGQALWSWAAWCRAGGDRTVQTTCSHGCPDPALWGSGKPEVCDGGVLEPCTGRGTPWGHSASPGPVSPHPAPSREAHAPTSLLGPQTWGLSCSRSQGATRLSSRSRRSPSWGSGPHSVSLPG